MSVSPSSKTDIGTGESSVVSIEKPGAQVVLRSVLSKKLLIVAVALIATGVVGTSVFLGVYYGTDDGNDEPVPTLCDEAPCLNGGTCGLDDTYGYICSCQDSFTGRHCQVNINDVTCEEIGGCCVSWREDNVTSCSNREDSYRCYCDEGCLSLGQCCVDFKEYCQWDMCKTSPCLNGAECVLNENLVTGYECVCTEPFTGTHCQVDKNDYLCEDLGGCCIGNDTNAIGCSRSTIGYRCYCDEFCPQTNDCCLDYDVYCLNQGFKKL